MSFEDIKQFKMDYEMETDYEAPMDGGHKVEELGMPVEVMYCGDCSQREQFQMMPWICCGCQTVILRKCVIIDNSDGTEEQERHR